MIIWRNLDPRLLGELLVAAAESLTLRRRSLRQQAAVRLPFRGNTALGGSAPLCRRRSHP